MTIAGRLRPYLQILARHGLIGSTEDEVVRYLVGSGLREMFASGYFQKHEEQMRLLKERVKSDGRRI